MKNLLSLCVCLLLAVLSQARTITVNWDGSEDYLTIQAAINDANDGDTILVADGRYTGDGNRDIFLRGKKITVKSENGPENCIIDCNGALWDFHWGFYIKDCENSDTVIDGFTIINGYQTRAGGGGGAFRIVNSNCLITNCWLFNHKGVHGGAIRCTRSSARITNCIIADNFAWRGSGVYCENGNHESRNGNNEISNCLFVGNIARMGGFAQWGTISCFSSNTFIQSCTLVNNNYGVFVIEGNVEINSCILQNENYEISTLNWYRSTVNVANCLIQGFKIREGDNSTIIMLDGNIDVDPCFFDPNNGDYRLLEDSPCIDAGDPNYIAEPNETDLDGQPRVIGGRIDMGAYEYSPAIPAEVRIVPRTINLTSQGKRITCYIWLPEDYNVADIDPNSVLLEHEIEAESLRVDEQQQVAVAKFSRSEIQSILNIGQAELTITGQLTDGTVFEGTDVIRVIDKGSGKPTK